MDASLLSLRQAPASRMLALVRKHWGIENGLHWRRDVTLGEDACQTRTGAVPSLLARLNSTVLCLLDRLGVGNVARQARYFDAHLEQAIQLLLTGRCSVFENGKALRAHTPCIAILVLLLYNEKVKSYTV